MADDKQENIDETPVQEAPVKSGKGSEKKTTSSKQQEPPKGESKPMQLISLSEYVANTDREISSVLQHGFKVWMKTDRNEPLRARMHSDWDKLIDEYLVS